MSVFISIVAVLIILGVLATVHELGHFFVSRMFKVKAYEVSIFVGPALFKWKRNDVEYTIRCIPIGAYVRFNEIDENGNAIESDDPNLLLNQPRWKRLIISLAGPFVNLLIGILIFAIYFCSTGYMSTRISETYKGTQLYGQEYTVGDKIVAVDGRPVFTEDDLFIYFDFKSQSEEAVLTLKSEETGKRYDVKLVPEFQEKVLLGVTRKSEVDPITHGWEVVTVDEKQNNGNPLILPGDFITHIDGHPVEDETDTLEYIDSKSNGDVVTVTYVRNGETCESDIVLYSSKFLNPRGVVLSREHDFLGEIATAVKMPASIFNMTGIVISNAFKGEVEIYNVVSGPVGVVNVVDSVVSDERADTGIKISTLVMLSGMISVALCISNMLPLPGLDGFQLVVIVIEMIIGRKLPDKGEKIIAVVGFFVLILLVLLAFASDIAKIVIEGW